jgi:predicted chitinase
MLLSPPFCPPRAAAETEDQYIDRAMRAGTAGDGGFPVSFDMNWHGGIHLTAPPGRGNNAVRAIADGKITFLRKPTRRSTDPSHPLNYRGGWTDDGCIVIQHDTMIGFDAAKSSEVAVRFFSVYMHLGALQRLSVGDDVFRKDALGTAGSVYGVVNRVHVEVVCDDANVQVLTGRKDPFTPIDRDGRTDVIYGKIWFLCLVGTTFLASRPRAGRPRPAVAFTNDEALFISMELVGGDAEFTTHHLDGRPLGDPVVATNYVNKMIQNAGAFTASPITGFDLLRFGRELDGGTVLANVPNFQEVRTPSGTGFVDLNDSKIRKFSDADFPSWEGGTKSGWKLIDGSTSQDARCNDIAVVEALDIDADLVVTPQEAKQRLGDTATQRGLSRKICKFPSEWEQATIDSRFAFLKTEPRLKLTASDFAKFRAHVAKLCFWAGTQPGIAANHWHFHPREFIRQFRKCLWLSQRELAQCVPRKTASLSGTTFSNRALANFARATTLMAPWSVTINRLARKYLISHTAQRLAHFLAQVLEETGLLRFMKEIGGENKSYAPYYGRGVIQLTLEGNYDKYGKYRGFPATNPSTNPKFSAIGWDPDVLLVLDDNNFNRDNAADAGGHFWTKAPVSNGNARADAGITVTEMVSVSRYINGPGAAIQNLNGIDMRLSMFVYLKYQLLDEVRTSNVETISFTWRRNSAKEPQFNLDGTPRMEPDGKGGQRQVTRFVAGNHTVDFPLDPQRP